MSIQSCSVCYTDVAVGHRNLLDGSVAVVLTSWKNLGYGKALDDHYWQSHLGRGAGSSHVGHYGSIGTVYTAFEGPFLPYVPQLQD